MEDASNDCKLIGDIVLPVEAAGMVAYRMKRSTPAEGSWQ